MDFRFDDEQLALREAIRAFCGRHFAPSDIASREGVPVAAATWLGLHEMGVFAMLPTLADEGATGNGDDAAGDEIVGGAVEAAIMFEQFGLHVATGPRLWSTIAAPLLGDVDFSTTKVAGIVASDAPSAGYVVEHGGESDVLIIVTDDGVERTTVSALNEVAIGEPLDPLTPAVVCAELPHGQEIGGPAEARRLRIAGTILASAELVGVAQGALDVAAAYALERHQFGKPIGSFQAIKHILADMYVRVELARSAMYAAAAIFDDGRAGEVTTAASTAKLLAGEAGLANGKSAVQVLGGMGFTWEMTPHYFLKRAWVLEENFGTGDTHANALSTALALEIQGAGAWT